MRKQCCDTTKLDCVQSTTSTIDLCGITALFYVFFRQIYIKISEDLGILFDSNGAFNFCLLCCCVLLKTLLLQLPDGCQVSMSCWLDPGDRTVLIHHPFTVNKTTDQKSSRRSASQVSGESWHNGLTFWKIIEII